MKKIAEIKEELNRAQGERLEELLSAYERMSGPALPA